jgi:hypothetical protein
MNILALTPLSLKERWQSAVSRLYSNDNSMINEYGAVGGMKIGRRN